MSKHPIHFNYLSQDDLIQAGAFDLPMVIETAGQAMLDFEQQKILFPEKIVQIFNQVTQERINCLPATLLQEKVCGVKWVSVFPHNHMQYDAQNLSAIFCCLKLSGVSPLL
jgi:ornithine cyclodeaminase/alanine dehydrogenase-like protein (mu-crystallin family)